MSARMRHKRSFIDKSNKNYKVTNITLRCFFQQQIFLYSNINKTREDSRASQRKGKNNKSDQNDILFRVLQK